jgi:hypothetical protein
MACQLLNRLTAHEMASSRAFSTLNSKRPTPSSTTSGTAPRYFNTSRSLKAVGDTSTIDFAFIPDFDPDSSNAAVVRVPIMPQTEPTEAAKVHTAADGEDAVRTHLSLTLHFRRDAGWQGHLNNS